MKSTKPNPQPPLSVLIVEDDYISRTLEAKLVSTLFNQVLTADNGQDGLIKYLEFYNQYQTYPDLVIADLEMPIKNGYELISAIKTYHPNQYIIVISSHNTAESLARLIELSVDKFLFKPINTVGFINALKHASASINKNKTQLLQNKQIEEDAFRFNMAIDGKGDGLWDWNIQTGEVYFSPTWKHMLGFEDHEIQGSLDEWQSRVHPEQLAVVFKDIQAHLDGQTQYYENEHLLLCKNGEYKWILDRGVVVERDENDQPVRMIGTHTDVDERKKMQLALRNQRQELETIFNTNVDGLAIMDLETRFLKTNKAYRQIVKYTEQELSNISCKQMTAIEDHERVEKMLQQTLQQGAIENFEKRCIVKNGQEIYVNISMALMPDKQRFLVSARDITEVKKQAQIIHDYLQIINDNIISFSVDACGNLTEISDCYESKSKCDRGPLIGRPFVELLCDAMPDLDFNQITKAHQDWSGELKLRTQDASELWVSAHLNPRTIGLDRTGYTFICQDITDKKQIERLSSTDSLTKLFNRRHFERFFVQLLDIANQVNDILSFMILDIDHFKNYNDLYGHQAGDNALTQVANSLSQTFNRSDDYCFRLGGEEFAVLFITKTTEDAIHLAESARLRIEQRDIQHLQNPPYGCLTVSVGLFLIQRNDTPDLEQVYRKADQLLYQAKNSGRNRLCWLS